MIETAVEQEDTMLDFNERTQLSQKNETLKKRIRKI